MSETLFEDVIPPRDWFELEHNARPVVKAATELAYAVRMQWVERTAFRDQHVLICCANAANAGLDEEEICNIIHNERRGMINGEDS